GRDMSVAWQIRSILWCWRHRNVHRARRTGPSPCPFAVRGLCNSEGSRSAVVGNNYDIILIGLVAVFLILRLRAVLGKRTGSERPPARDPFTPPAPPQAPPSPPRLDAPSSGSSGASGNDNVVPMPAPTPARPSLAVHGPGGIRATVL